MILHEQKCDFNKVVYRWTDWKLSKVPTLHFIFEFNTKQNSNVQKPDDDDDDDGFV